MKDLNEFYDWLQNDIMKPAVIRNSDKVLTVIRVPYDDDFDYLYYQDNYNGQPLTTHINMTYCGLYDKLNGFLYDLRYPLRGQLSEIDSGKTLIDINTDLIKDVRAVVERVVDNNIHNLRSPYFEDDRCYQRLDEFRESYADSAVKKMFLNNQSADEIQYQCDFSLKKSTDNLILRYLKYPSATVEEVATAYWQNHQDDILLGLYKNGILRTKLLELQADTDNPLHKQLAINNALYDSGAKTVNVTVHKDGQSFAFKYPADRLSRYSNSDYGTWDMSPKDRQGFEECFGRHSSFHPEDITGITYRGKTIYEAEVSHQTEDEVLTDDESEDSDESFVISM